VDAYEIPFVPETALEFRAVRASGPGGQHVNKTSSAVQLRCDLNLCASMPGTVRTRLRSLAGRRLNDEDVIVIAAQRSRSQEDNRRDAIERLRDLVEQASIVPKVRRATRPTRASKQRRLETKQQRANVKQQRTRVRDIDERLPAGLFRGSDRCP
jgi:ribosome-associated protein